MKISIITPVWNRVDLTHTFLASHWIRYNFRPDIEWIIIDNGSTDGTQQLLSTMSISMRHRLKVLTNTENKGFSAACNQGAAIATGDVVIFVNNDVIISGDYIGIIEAQLVKTHEALVGAVLFDFDTGWNFFGGVLVEYLPGWCLAMRAEVFNGLGGFDERYSPCDYEDMDLCYAATQAGLDLVAIPLLPITHMDSQTARSYMPERREITERNRIKFKKKWRL